MTPRILTARCLPLLAIAAARGDEPKEPAKKPRIEVRFVLDTTGPMSGLIEGANEKIWSIANEMIAAKPTPELQLVLIRSGDARARRGSPVREQAARKGIEYAK